jgi:hypothetical protein
VDTANSSSSALCQSPLVILEADGTSKTYLIVQAKNPGDILNCTALAILLVLPSKHAQLSLLPPPLPPPRRPPSPLT